MSMREIVKDSVDQSVVIRIIDSTTGLPEQAVEHDSGGIAMWYRREGGTKQTVATAALAALDTAHTDGGIEHIDDGYYRFDLPDAAVATGVNGVMVGGAVTGMIVMGTYVPLIDFNKYGTPAVSLTQILGTALTEGAGSQVADAFTKLFDVASPLLLASAAMRGTDSANTTVPDAAGVAATPAEVATALTDIFLDQLFAADYDPASPPGVATALLNELIESNAGVSRYTAAALAQASGTGASVNDIWNALKTAHQVAGSMAEELFDAHYPNR